MSNSKDTERWNTWIASDLVRALRVTAAVTGLTQRAITEGALREWMVAHPIDADQIAAAIKAAVIEPMKVKKEERT